MVPSGGQGTPTHGQREAALSWGGPRRTLWAPLTQAHGPLLHLGVKRPLQWKWQSAVGFLGHHMGLNYSRDMKRPSLSLCKI